MDNEIMLSERADGTELDQRAQAKAEECQIEAAVYRNGLEECKRRAEAGLVDGVISCASLALDTSERKLWGKEWKERWDQDIGRLEEVLKAAKQIATLISQFCVTDGSENAAIQARVLEIIEKIVAYQPGSSVNV